MRKVNTLYHIKIISHPFREKRCRPFIKIRDAGQIAQSIHAVIMEWQLTDTESIAARRGWRAKADQLAKQ